MDFVVLEEVFGVRLDLFRFVIMGNLVGGNLIGFFSFFLLFSKGFCVYFRE